MVKIPDWLRKTSQNAIPFRGGPRSGTTEPHLPGPGVRPPARIDETGGLYLLRDWGTKPYYEWVIEGEVDPGDTVPAELAEGASDLTMTNGDEFPVGLYLVDAQQTPVADAVAGRCRRTIPGGPGADFGFRITSVPHSFVLNEDAYYLAVKSRAEGGEAEELLYLVALDGRPISGGEFILE